MAMETNVSRPNPSLILTTVLIHDVFKNSANTTDTSANTKSGKDHQEGKHPGCWWHYLSP